MIAKDLVEAAGKLTKRLSLPPDFLERLLQEDDWSLLIKAHALLESSLTYLLLRKTGFPSDFFDRIDMEHRIRLAEKLGLLDKETRGTMRMLSRYRNRVVHKIENVDFSFKQFLSDRNRWKNFVKHFIHGETRSAISYKPEYGKFIVYWATLAVLSTIYIEDEKRSMEEEHQRAMDDFIELLRSSLPDLEGWRQS